MEITFSYSLRPRHEKSSVLVDDYDPSIDPFPSSFYNSSNNRHLHCCRHTLVINFRSLGWNWFIAPHRHNTYFCSGIYPRFYQSPSSLVHSHLLKQAWPAGYHGLCFAPASLASISILLFHDQRRVLSGMFPRWSLRGSATPSSTYEDLVF